MQKYVYYLVAVVIAAMLWIFQSPKRAAKPPSSNETVVMPEGSPTPIENQNDGSGSAQAPVDIPPDAIPDATSDSRVAAPTPPRATTRQKPTVIQSLPKVDRVREEVKRDPHSPPPSGVTFALGLATRMEEAQKSKESAEAFFSELETCGTNRDASAGVPSMKALCIQSARDLTKIYPEFQSRYDEMKKKADPRAASIADQVQ
jgi:hypothetical protein